MGHVGLTPQTRHGARRLAGAGPHRGARRSGSPQEALALEEAGCFAIVFEAIPAAVAAELMPLMRDPGDRHRRGPATDGQVLVFHDLLGIRDGLGAALRQALREPAGRDERRRRRVRARRSRTPATPGPSTATRSPTRSSRRCAERVALIGDGRLRAPRRTRCGAGRAPELPLRSVKGSTSRVTDAVGADHAPFADRARR